MLVIYWDKTARKHYEIEVRVYEDEPNYAGCYPSECQWIVPGTVDPRDD
jgi:hypothetical protein